MSEKSFYFKLGIPFYGRTFTLKNQTSPFIGSETVGNGLAGEYTREAGFMAYGFEICNSIKSETNWTRQWSSEQMVPYMYNNYQWIGYDDQESIKIKV
jgi:chitinase